MATRRDQLHSYQFLLQRVISALVYRKTDPAQSPFRRAGVAVFSGVMLTVLALAVTAAIGLFVNGFGQQDDWRDGGKVIMESETGATYVVLPPSGEGDGPENQVLYPTLNFASAALLAGTHEVIEVSQYSLQEESIDEDRTIPRGTPVGIQGAPNSIPTRDAILSSAWTLCSRLSDPDASDSDTKSTLFVGKMSMEGADLGSDEALLLEDAEDTYLLSEGHLHSIPDADEVLGPLNWTNANVKTVDAGFVAGIPQGSAIQAPSIENIGEESSELAGFNIGDVFENSTGNTTAYRAVLDDGVAYVTELQAELLRIQTGQADFETGSEASQVGEDKTRDLRPSEEKSAPPESPPDIAASDDGGNSLSTCARFSGAKDSTEASVVYDAQVKENVAGTTTSGVNDEGKDYADVVAVTPGTGAIVTTGTRDNTLITDTGFAYGLEQGDHGGGEDEENGGGSGQEDGMVPTANALTALGFAGNDEEDPVETVHMPSQILSLIPQGPALDPAHAMDTVPRGSE